MPKKKKEPDKLAQDAAAAKAAGLSYGKWRAMQNPVTIEKKPPEIPDGWLVCEWCGKPFKPKIKRKQRFCEPFCQQQAYNEKYRQKKSEYMRAWKAKRRESMSNP